MSEETKPETTNVETKAAKAPRKRSPPLSPEEFQLQLDDCAALIKVFEDEYSTSKRKNYQFPPSAPSAQELKKVRERLLNIVKPYTELYNMKRAQKQKPKPKNTGVLKGFSIPRFMKPDGMRLINECCDVPDDLKIEALPELNGDGIGSHAQTTQCLSYYIHTHGLKKQTTEGSDKKKKTIYELDDFLREIFKPFYGKCAEGDITVSEDSVVVTHNGMQRMAPFLFNGTLSIPPSLLTPERVERSAKRDALFKKRTETFEKEESDRKKAAKEKKDAAKKAKQEAE